MLMSACGGGGTEDELGGAEDELGALLAEIEDIYARARPLLEAQVEAQAVAEQGVAEVRESLNDATRAERNRLSGILNQRRVELLSMPDGAAVLASHQDNLEHMRITHRDDTWDLITGGMVSPRSVLIDLRRTAETELARLEAGCSARSLFGAGDCEVGEGTVP